MFGGYIFYVCHLGIFTFGNKQFLHLRVSKSYVWGLDFLRFGVRNSYVWGLVSVTFRGEFSYVRGLIVLQFGVNNS